MSMVQILFNFKAHSDCESDCLIRIALFAFQTRVRAYLVLHAKIAADRNFSNSAFCAAAVITLVPMQITRPIYGCK